MTEADMQKIPAPLVGLYSPVPGSGKTTLAEALSLYRFRRLRFANPLKRMLFTLLQECGCPTDLIVEHIEGSLKEVPSAYLNGCTPRFTMQTLGTEWGRQHMGDTFWRDALIGRADLMRGEGIPVVVDDVRFPNEAEGIRAAGGILIRITRPSVMPAAGVVAHASEGALDGLSFDLEITNDAACATAFGTKWARIVEAVAYGRPELCG